jgi:hypothetical protein
MIDNLSFPKLISAHTDDAGRTRCAMLRRRSSRNDFGASADGKPHSTSGSIQGLGYLLTALRRQRLTSDKLVLQLATFLRSHDLFLELSVWTPRALTANQVRHSGELCAEVGDGVKG